MSRGEVGLELGCTAGTDRGMVCTAHGGLETSVGGTLGGGQLGESLGDLAGRRFVLVKVPVGRVSGEEEEGGGADQARQCPANFSRSARERPRGVAERLRGGGEMAAMRRPRVRAEKVGDVGEIGDVGQVALGWAVARGVGLGDGLAGGEGRS